MEVIHNLLKKQCSINMLNNNMARPNTPPHVLQYMDSNTLNHNKQLNK